MKRCFRRIWRKASRVFEYWDFWRQMGYDTASMEFCLCGVLIGGGAVGNTKTAALKIRRIFERYPWQDIPRLYFEAYAPYIRNFAEACPPGMRAIGGVGNGLFETVQDLVGYMDLCYIKGDDEELLKIFLKQWGMCSIEFGNALWRSFQMFSVCCALAMIWALTP